MTLRKRFEEGMTMCDILYERCIYTVIEHDVSSSKRNVVGMAVSRHSNGSKGRIDRFQNNGDNLSNKT